MHATAASIHHETHHFYAVVRALAYKEADFALRAVRWPRTARPVSVTHDLMIVKRKSSDIEKAYPLDSDGTGMLAFFDDLLTGVFGAR